MAMAVGPNRGVKSDINITPLVDVVLVLLIIFMVITPMLQRGKDVKLPKALKIDPESKSNPLIVSITTEHKVYIEKDEVPDDDLEGKLRAIFAVDPGKKILLKGDGSLLYEDVRKVLDHARKAGSKGISLGVEQLKE